MTTSMIYMTNFKVHKDIYCGCLTHLHVIVPNYVLMKSCVSCLFIDHSLVSPLTSFFLQYECRKTLADSRPRVRGRFARNDEIEKAPQNHDHPYVEEDDDDDYNWLSILDALSTNLIP